MQLLKKRQYKQSLEWCIRIKVNKIPKLYLFVFKIYFINNRTLRLVQY